MRRTSLAVSILSALTLALAACGGSSGGSGSESDESSASHQTVAGEQVNFHGTKDVTDATSVDIEADNFYFEPSVVTGKPGEQVAVHIKNEGTTEHNFSVTSQNVNKDLETGDSATINVTIPASGVIAFFCEYHRSKGMAGGLAVTGASLSGGSGGSGQTSGGTTGSGSSGYGGSGYGGTG